MKNILFVGLGGAVGSIFRYLVSLYGSKVCNAKFPVGTFVVNILGCLIIGLLLGYFGKYLDAQSNSYKLLLVTGFCGGFTTFSTFSSETLTLFRAGDNWIAISYVVLSVIVGLLAVYCGLEIMKFIISK